MKKQRLLNFIEILILVVALSTIAFYAYNKIYSKDYSEIKSESSGSSSNTSAPKRTTPPEKPNPGGL